ncbi:MAG: M23 family metallopeptidase [Treponema sp.]|jgi:murein DD-endopeptidase MepM/ murein hydrolase activator NlpD|nr:M23 family metallopeptidase [Treponema sp.]
MYLLCGLLILPLQSAGADPQNQVSDAKQESPLRKPRLQYTIIPDNPRPGEPVTIALIADPVPGGELRASLRTLKGDRLSRASFFAVSADTMPDTKPDDGGQPFWAAVLAVPSTAASGFAVIHVETEQGLLAEIPLVLTERKFASEEIELNQTLTDIRTAPDPQKTAESELLWAIISRTGNEVYSAGNFIPPVTSTRRTSFFGDRRVFKYANGKKDTSIHAGVDYGVPTGTAVSACAGGKVVLARFRIVTGNSVIIEHLPGVYSLYYHLDKIDAAEGAMVAAGAVLGQSGSTGLATGPHLHWEIRVSGENTDPDAFVARPILDKTAILTKMNTGNL